MGTELNLIITFRSYFDFLLFYLHFHVLYNYKFFPLVKRGGGREAAKETVSYRSRPLGKCWTPDYKIHIFHTGGF